MARYSHITQLAAFLNSSNSTEDIASAPPQNKRYTAALLGKANWMLVRSDASVEKLITSRYAENADRKTLKRALFFDARKLTDMMSKKNREPNFAYVWSPQKNGHPLKANSTITTAFEGVQIRDASRRKRYIASRTFFFIRSESHASEEEFARLRHMASHRLANQDTPPCRGNPM